MVRLMLRRTVVLACGLVGCGGAEAAREPAALAEMCGVEGPIQLLAVEPGREVAIGPQRFGEHYLYVTGRPGADRYSLDDPQLWSTGPCGEDPRRIAEDVRYPIGLERWPDVALGCRDEARDIVSLDLAGVEPPHVVFADIHCFAPRTPHGLVEVGDQSVPRPVALHPYPDDPRSGTSEPVVFLEETPVPALLTLSRPIVLQDHIFLIDADNALLRIDLPDGDVHVEQAGVREFEVSRDGRYLLWQDSVLTNDDPARPEGAVFLRDRTTGEGIALAQTNLRYGSFHFGHLDAGYMELVLRNGVTRVYTLPALSFFDLPRSVALDRQISDGRWLLQPWWGGPIYLTDLVDPASTTVLTKGGHIIAAEPDGVLIQDLQICCTTAEAPFETSPVWFVPFDGSQARRVADEVGRSPVVLDRRRIIATADRDGDAPARLVLIDRETRGERLIDEEVVVADFRAIWPLGDGAFWYEVDDGERSGVWAVRLPPPP